MPAHDPIIKMLSSGLVLIMKPTRDVHIFGHSYTKLDSSVSDRR